MNATSASSSKVDSIRKTITVQASPAHAFEIFTTRHGSWWPVKTHHIGKVAAETAVMEPMVGGRWYERGEDGSECEWGKVLAWEPPLRVVLAWQIGADWQYHPDLVTEVEVRFVAEGQGQTRVELEHRKLEAFGEMAGPLRQALDWGWPGILGLFAATANEGAK